MNVEPTAYINVAYDAFFSNNFIERTGGTAVVRNWKRIFMFSSADDIKFHQWNLWEKQRSPQVFETFFNTLITKQLKARRLYSSKKIQLFLFLMPPGLLSNSLPQLIYVHDVPLARENQRIKDRIYNYLVTYSAKKSIQVLTPTLTQKKRLINNGINENSINVLPYPIDSVYWQKSQTVKPKKTNVLVVLSSLLWRKHPEAIFRVYDRLPLPTRNLLTFTIAGNINDLSSSLPADCKKHLSKFILVNLPSNEELAVLYQNALCTVMLSKFEGYGLPVAESMASGTPVIVSNDPSLKEVAGEGGWSCDADDYDKAALLITKMVEDGASYQKLSEKALLASQKYRDLSLFNSLKMMIKKSIHAC